MPRFPVSFGRRRSTADSLDHGAVAAEPSFRVLERPDASNGKSFDGGARNSAYKPGHNPKASISVDLTPMDDNIFADLKTTNRNASTAPSSTHENVAAIPEDSKRPVPKKSYQDIPLPPIPKSSSSGFLRAAGRTLSFGTKKNLSSSSVGQESDMQSSAVDQHGPEQISTVGRPRTTTSSTTSTATPPKLDESSSFDLGGDFSKMLSFEKRKSTLTLKDDQNGRQALGPRSLTGNRLNQPQPSPLTIDKTSRIEPSPFSWGSHHSGDGLLNSPSHGNENAPPVPKHGSTYSSRPQGPSPSSSEGNLQAGHLGNDRRLSGEGEGEDTSLLKDISTATRFLKSGNAQTGNGRYRRDEDTLGSGYKQFSSPKDDEDLFDTSLVNSSRAARRYVAEKPSPPRNKVMTPAEFERYRQDKERGSENGDKSPTKDDDDDDEDINYEDDDDELEKSKQAAKQRQKQEAHMTVYRQQMMKVTGEPATGVSARPGFSASFSTPNLLQPRGPSPNKSVDASGESDEDEEVPLAILAAHGFPNKNRPPHRLSTMMSNPNLKVAAQASYARPGSSHGDSPASNGPSPSSGRLPAFARNLPQDPFVGAGLVNHPVRESLSFGAGAPAALQTPGVPPGGLVGVIAGEERARALRRGSPAIDTHKPLMPMSGPGAFDPLGAVPSHMMYPAPNPRPLSTVDQTQAQMNQMQQFMQMQMQFMQMQMMQSNGNRMSQIPQMAPQMPGMPGGQMLGNGMMGNPGDMRHSFVDNGSMFDLPIRPEQHGRSMSMSMVQPSSASWIQPPMPGPGYTPSIRVQGAGYAPSIAPSERSNIGLPGRYRPVSQMPAAAPAETRKSSTMSGALGWDQPRTKSPLGFGAAKTPSPGPDAAHSKKTITAVAADDEDEDDEQAWAAMKQKREKKRSLWKSKKSFGTDLSLMIK
ncbi:hypothetical protein PpBr36_05405 [Pyricularia pennisetigena]|uniref:hypothetical protein n=1 Tax=Pyricularia pennisetigena TaxID=1578925 RepID=UPI0011510D8A|nr:hypothetical protein PpBr36_05405 [Pyricularia pennisetigena]TLS27618.1 hypothetical protein PpBr36_05405 [Pyricularia pennisetigena]